MTTTRSQTGSLRPKDNCDQPGLEPFLFHPECKFHQQFHDAQAARMQEVEDKRSRSKGTAKVRAKPAAAPAADRPPQSGRQTGGLSMSKRRISRPRFAGKTRTTAREEDAEDENPEIAPPNAAQEPPKADSGFNDPPGEGWEHFWLAL